MKKTVLALSVLAALSGPAFAACTSPSAPTGKIIYNTAHDVFQGCAATGQWLAFSGSGQPGPQGEVGPAGPQGPQGNQGVPGEDGSDAPADNLGNHTATQSLSMGAFKITNTADPTAAQDVATKAYVDAAGGISTQVVSGSGSDGSATATCPAGWSRTGCSMRGAPGTRWEAYPSGADGCACTVNQLGRSVTCYVYCAQ